MPTFDVVVFTESAPGANGLIAGAASDSLYRIDGDNIEVGTFRNLILGIWCNAVSTGAGYRIQQPGLDPDYYFDKVKLSAGHIPELGWTHLFAFPMPLQKGTKMTCQAVNATDEAGFVALLLGDGPLGYPVGAPQAVLTGYSDTTLVADTWTGVTVTWDDDLPPGYYSILGCKAAVYKSSDAEPTAYRLILPGKTETRPGGPAAIMEASHAEVYQTVVGDAKYSMWGEIGAWFRHNRMPNMEMCSGEAAVDEEIQIFVRQIEPGSK